VRGIGWPAIPIPPAAALLAVQFQLEQSQWWSPQTILQHQFRQLAGLVAHARNTVPFYADHYRFLGDAIKNGISPGDWVGLPLLKREDIQRSGDALMSKGVPPDHGRVVGHTTSGSTGKPIRFSGTEITHFFWCAGTLRDHLWHKRDLTGKLAVIRTSVNDGEGPGWGPATDVAYVTGLSATLNIAADIDTQVKWLERQNPDYLLSHPSNLLALARRCLALGIRLPHLRQVRTFGECLAPDLRSACMGAWGASVADAYSAEEVGYIALQCSDHEHYHIQSENLLIEVLDEHGVQCMPGEIGRVVVTTLHNFAMPLIRYEIGDYAEVGEPCPCGRGLPVLKRILGRQRNLLTLPDGKQHWPSFPGACWLPIAPVRQFQLVQHDMENIEVRFVADRPIASAEERGLTAMLQDRLGYPFRIVFTQLPVIGRNPNFKFEDFISEVLSAR